MGNFTYKTLLFIIYILIFCIVSKIIFINVYDTAGYVVDEYFHIPQGLNYCQLNFSRWDPKITTLPGLYLVSTLLMAPLGFCTVYGLRLTNLIASILNFPLFVALFRIEYDGSKPLSWPTLFSGINLGILPPLYFFSHLYYTDTLSVTTILLMLLLSKKGCHISASIIGAFSIIVRQTNIIWVGLVFGENALNIFVHITAKKKQRSKKNKNHCDFWTIYESFRNFFKTGVDFNKLTREHYKVLCSYLSVIIAFIIFVILNGSIVVGDKTAHVAELHIPQLFYFSLFCVIFALPHFCLEIVPFLKFIFKNKLLSMFLLATCISIVHYNTLVHPYLLADNRHYTFYVWNRIYAKYEYAKYALVVVYIFAMYAGLKRIDPVKNFGFLLLYIPCTLLALILQKLLDIRYFFIPFILLRLKFKTTNFLVLFVEYFFYLLINYLTFYIFFTKEIRWDDIQEPQRMIW